MTSPVISYTSLDFDSIKEDMIAYAQTTYGETWTDFNDTQFGVVMLDLVAYLGDLLAYQTNAGAREAFFTTALRKQNVLNHAKALDYFPGGADSATGSLRATLDPGASYPLTILKTEQVSNGSNDDEVFFHPVSDVTVAAYPGSGYVDFDIIEGERFTNFVIGVSDGSPNQNYQFPQDSIVQDSVSVVVGAAQYELVSNFAESLSTSKHCKLTVNDDSTAFLSFGDGIYGMTPPASQNVTVTFRVGGGRRGNLSAGSIETIVNMNSAVLSVTNPSATTGGDNEPNLKVIKTALAGSLATLDRGVTAEDYALLALQVAGVAKARSGPGTPIGSRRIKVWIAPSGGGDPSNTLKNAVSAFLSTTTASNDAKKMVTNNMQIQGPVYKDLEVTCLVHVSPSFRASDTESAFRNSLINAAGTGLLDFAQLDFAGLDANKQHLLSQTKLQDYFKESLASTGVDRVEFVRLTTTPTARAKDSGNSGNGTCVITASTLTRPRLEYKIVMTSAASYDVYARIVGRVTSFTETTLTDDLLDYDTYGVSSFSGYRLLPDRNGTTYLTVDSAADQTITVTSGQTSLFLLTADDAEYVLYHPTPLSGVPGTPLSAGDVTILVTTGTTPFVAGDTFYVDVFPSVGDIRLRDDEYPRLPSSNLITRTAGGAKVLCPPHLSRSSKVLPPTPTIRARLTWTGLPLLP